MPTYIAVVLLHSLLFLKEINAFFIGPKEDRDLKWLPVIGGWFIVSAPPAIGSRARPDFPPPRNHTAHDIIAVYMQLNLYGGILPT